MKFWLKLIFSILGVISLALLIWFAGPLLSIADVRPFESALVRFLLIAFIVVLTIAITFYKLYRRHKAIKELEEAVTEPATIDSDGQILSEKMNDALATLKKVDGVRRNALYELPWYLIIGPPGAGKTTALINSGLKFPLADSSGPKSIAGLGGTRYCDWWFTEDAVLIDTAGRYTTHDSEPESDRHSWFDFLDLLSKNRPKQPINGVLIAISIEDILILEPAEVIAHADAIRKRLTDLHDHLKIDFPVYAVFTKADLIAGFMEYFGGLNESRRKMVWGATFKTDEQSRNMIGGVPHEFDALVARLNEEITDKLQEEPDPYARVALYGFPTQFAMLKEHVVNFLNRVFEPTRYRANAMLRGFYFTSGTQEGTPIDQAIGAMARSFGAQSAAPIAYSGIGKSFFLTDLLSKVVFAEAGWVSTNRAAVRRATGLQIAGYSALVILTLATVGLWWTSYNANSQLVEETRRAAEEYIEVGAPLMEETSVADTNFYKALVVLHKLRYMPAGYAFREESTPISHTFGLSQRDRLESASISAYRIALERTFRSRLILRLEKQIERSINNPVFVYEALKVYLMLGGLAPTDNEFVVAWMRGDWAENLYPGSGNADGRTELEQHLVAMLDLQSGHKPQITLNQPLVDQGQKTLARMSVAERAYALLKSQARTGPYEDWIVTLRGGPDTARVFENAKGEDLDELRVPRFFTYVGFHSLFLDQLADIADQIKTERWVLGKAGEQAAIDEQYKTLLPDLLDIYRKEFIAAWDETLAKLRLRPLSADRPKYIALSAASSPTSPIRQLLESIRDETALTQEREVPESDNNDLVEGEAGRVGRRLASRTGRVGRAGFNLAMKAQLRAGAGGSAPQAPGQNIEAYFKPFHDLVDGDSGKRPIDTLVSNLNEIYRNLVLIATNPVEAPRATANLQIQVATLRANSSRLPEPLAGMMRVAADDFEGDATGTSIAQLRQALAEEVTAVCQNVVPNRYPISRKSKRDVPMRDFARVFAPGGVIDGFFKKNLASMADASGTKWKWRAENRVARDLSPKTLLNFQQAAEIRDAFFPSGGNMPSLNIQIEPVTLSGSARLVELEVNGNVVVSRKGFEVPTSFQWPGSLGRQRAAITITPVVTGFFGRQTNDQGRSVTLERTGAWAFFRLLDAGRVVKRGDSVTARFVVGGREVSYRISADSFLNPLVLPALRNFSCPAGL